MSRPLKSRSVRANRASVWTEHPVDVALAGVVECTWEGEGAWARGLRLLPDGCVDLVWDGERLSAVVPGDRAMRGAISATSRNVGLRLRCGAGGAVLDRPLAVVADRRVALEESLDRLSRHGEARLRAARDPGRQREILVELVAHRLADGASPDPAVVAIAEQLKTHSAMAIAKAAEIAGVDERALRRRFAASVGLGPKRLQRVFRFVALARRLGEVAARRGSAAGLAAELGYADQAHMIRECRQISGSTPGALVAAWRA
jgi:AraC-like DNA-binding protein